MSKAPGDFERKLADSIAKRGDQLDEAIRDMHQRVFYQEGGKEHDRAGKLHYVLRTRCRNCDAAISEMHYDCCGYASSGWQRHEPHQCTPKETAK